MQHVENDMDDLFKRAAEDYPLREGDGDWENIAKKISDKSGDDIVPAGKNNNNKKIIAVLLLLLMLPVSWFIITRNSTAISSITINEIKTGNDKNNKFTQPAIKNNDQPFYNKEKRNDDVANGDDQSEHYKKRLINTSRNVSVKPTTANSSDSFYAQNDRQISPEKLQEKKSVIENADNNLPAGKNEKENTGNINGEDPATSKVISEKDNTGKKELEDHLKKIDSPAITQNNKKEKTAGLPKKKGFYVGVVAGPDLSKVQSMAFSNTGIDGGLIAGLNIGKRLSLETGITWNKKYYNSQGKDFSMDKVGATMPSGMVIDNLAGNSSLIEVPIKVKYDFISKRSSAFFVSGGVSAYIMTKEKNKYNVTMNGNQEKITGTYNKNNYGLPAVANVSVGYQHNVNERLQIRIEPYLKIPLKGIGVGSLPITSTGLQVGIISRLK